jgi:hypothetical protein
MSRSRADTNLIPDSVGPSLYVFTRLAASDDSSAREALLVFLTDSGCSPLMLSQNEPSVANCLRKEWWRVHFAESFIPVLLQVWESSGRVLEFQVPLARLRQQGEVIAERFLDAAIGAVTAVHRASAIEAAIIGTEPYVAGALLDLWGSPTSRPTVTTPGTLWPMADDRLRWIPLAKPIDLSYLEP